MKNKNGFTIVELLIVIVVIGILAAISIVAYTGIQARARDSQRASDITQIKKALLSYNAIHSGVPRPNITGYSKATGEPWYGGWDTSTASNWLSFLRADNGNMPVDPANINPTSTTVADPLATPARAYTYYCYNNDGSPSSPNPPEVTIKYRKDDGTLVTENFKVDSCLTTLP